jgi:hypothetical protein
MRETVIWRGVAFSRDPDTAVPGNRDYFRPTELSRRAGVKALHTEIWQDKMHRVVPPGYVIHHLNFDPLDNRPGNLVCMKRRAHQAYHIRGREKVEHVCNNCGKTFLTSEFSTDTPRYCSPKCSATFRYRSGQYNETRVCQWCGREYSFYKYSPTKCCSHACGNRLRDAVARGEVSS